MVEFRSALSSLLVPSFLSSFEERFSRYLPPAVPLGYSAINKLFPVYYVARRGCCVGTIASAKSTGGA